MSSLISTKDGRKKVQVALHAQNFYDGAIDGKFGDLSTKAIIAARQHYGLSHPTEPVWDTELEGKLGLLSIQDPTVVGAAALGGLDLPSLFKLYTLITSIMKGNFTVDSKPWFESTTIWGAILSVLGTILAAFHINFGAADQATVMTIIEQVIAGIGALMAIWGRLRATTTIGPK